MESIQINVSKRQQSKLRNGHPIRINPAKNNDEDITIFLDESKIKDVMKAFKKDKSKTLTLSPQEIHENKTMEGGNLFKKAKKGIKKSVNTVSNAKKNSDKEILKGIKRGASETEKGTIKGAQYTKKGLAEAGDGIVDTRQKIMKDKIDRKYMLPVGHTALDIAALAAIGAATTLGGPMGGVAATAPILASRNVAKGYMKNPRAYHEKGGENQALEDANLGKVAASTMMSGYKANKKGKGLYAQKGNGLYAGRGIHTVLTAGSGLYGSGLYAGRGLYGAGLSSNNIITPYNTGSTLLNHENLTKSQPKRANYHKKNQLPPLFQTMMS